MTTLAALAVELETRSDAGLLRLLTLRQDAITPPVSNFPDLASRLCSVRSINLALDTLTLPQLQLLRALDRSQSVSAPSAAFDALHALALVVPGSATTFDGGSQPWVPLATVVAALGAGPSPTSGEESEISFSAPPLEGLTIHAAVRDNASASSIESLLRTMTQLLHELRTTPVAAMRGGATTLLSLRNLAKRLTLQDEQLHFYLELAAMAGLITFHPGLRQWVATPGNWATCERSQQWLVLVRAWLSSDRLAASFPTEQNYAKEENPGETVGNASTSRPLAAGASHPGLATLRNSTLSTLTYSPETNAPLDQALATSAQVSSQAQAPNVDSLVQSLGWRHPRLAVPARQLAAGILTDMELLGLCGAGAPSRAALALTATGSTPFEGATTEGAVLAELATILPAPLEHFLLQSDLTAIAPGHLAPALALRLSALAITEGSGAAGIFRFSEASLRRATAAGWSEVSIMEFLRKYSSTAVPQSLEYLIREAATGVAAAGRTTVPSGFDTSTPLDDSPLPTKARPPRTTGGIELCAAQQQLDLLRRSAPAVKGNEFIVALAMEQLRVAIEHGSHVSLRAVNGSGDIEQLLIRPTSFAEGLLRARVAATGAVRHFSAHRIVGVDPADVDPTNTETADAGPAHVAPARREGTA